MMPSPGEPTQGGMGGNDGLGGLGAGMFGRGGGGPVRTRSRIPTKALIGILAAFLLVGSLLHIGPAIKAGMHDGTHGTWVATAKECGHFSGCVWRGNFVLPDGHVDLTNASYAGGIPRTVHVGTSLPGLYPGGSALVFPPGGSSLWVSLLIGIVISLLGLLWACWRPVKDYLEHRRNAVIVTSTVPRA
jgi:hypothetical protein